ncbi:uncharacterized protein MONBRDRAFT_25825 [Monosiga brevicollis MX1]|uniref:RING-type E3 ubiquitin transferase BRCA1 n=1 Tax=Monosiga brevicollis TaxID=81824 RepID=A9V0J5_MONBE|nr:uncharacterized protein MONBRDRAFT_25825 [Monosiga brevicollis MX1]EDQ89027.1 predicted protein [Monosiga brevicollis MX1]|eukprot:XP_001746132.1 hypothetical protein [Monosiga brevicollis MX1]
MAATGLGFAETRQELRLLRSLLCCSLCNSGRIEKPFYLVTCGHYFCKECIVSKLQEQSSCPECHLPAVPKDLRSEDKVDAAARCCLALEQTLDKLTSQPRGLLERTNLPLGLGFTRSKRSLSQQCPASIEPMLDQPSLECSSIDDLSLPTIDLQPRKGRSRPASALRSQSKPQPQILPAAASNSVSSNSVSKDVTSFQQASPAAKNVNDSQTSPLPDANGNTSIQAETEPKRAKRAKPAKRTKRTRSATINDPTSAADGKIKSGVKWRRSNSLKTATPDAAADSPVSDDVQSSADDKSEIIDIKPIIPDASDIHTPNASRQGAKPRSARKSPKTHVNSVGESLLQCACKRPTPKMEVITKLLEEGAHVNHRDYNGWSPLHEAVALGHLAVVQLLLTHNADPNLQSHSRTTPLHDAVINDDVALVQALIQAGGNPYLTTDRGQSALDLARSEGVKSVLQSAPPPPAPGTATKAAVGKDGMSPIRFIAISGLDADSKALVEELCQQFELELCPEVNESVDVVIMEADEKGLVKRTLKYLAALLCGCWIVNATYLRECLEAQRLLPCEAFEVKGCSSTSHVDVPQLARISRMSNVKPLFDSVSFFIEGSTRRTSGTAAGTPPNADLRRLIELGGGKVVTRRSESTVVLRSSMPRHPRRSQSSGNCFTPADLLDCIANQEFLPSLS